MKARIKSNGKIVEVISRFMPRKRNAASRDWVCNLSDGTCINESQLEYIEESIDGLDEAAKKYEKRVIEETKCHHNALTYAEGYEDALLLIPDAFIAGAKWQAEQLLKSSPLPEDTVLFNKGVDEGRRLESEENKDRDIVFWRGIQYAKEQMLKDGLDAVKTLDFNKAEKTIAGVFVKYGMDLQKEQIMKEAIHYVVQDDLDSHGASYNIPFIRLGTVALKPKGIGVGDKVCIIIVKEN